MLNLRSTLMRSLRLAIGPAGFAFFAALVGSALVRGRDEFSFGLSTDWVTYATGSLFDGNLRLLGLLLPWMIFTCFDLAVSFNPPSLVRHGSRWNFVVHRLAGSALPTAILGVVAALVCGVLLSWGLPFATADSGQFYFAIAWTTTVQAVALLISALVIYLGVAATLVWTESVVAMGAVAGFGYVFLFAATFINSFVSWPVLTLARFTSVLASDNPYEDPVAIFGALAIAVIAIGVVFALATVARDRLRIAGFARRRSDLR